MPRSLVRRLIPIVALLGLAALLPAPSVGAGGSGNTVTISGRAYAFNHMDTFLAGATIRVREFPKLSATTDAKGDYELDVPNEANVTPYIEPPQGYHEIDLQTFHTRGEDLPNTNFQTPGDVEYFGLAAIVHEPLGADMRPVNCVIVTTASARNVRGVDYDTFEKRTPHGVPGTTGRAYPALPGPTYFNASVVPDSSQKETSEDGGMIWTSVPAGTYRIVATNPDTRFASFLATCEPGRVVNANPPWGNYELRRKEKPLGASIAAGSVVDARLVPKPGRDVVRFTVDAAERLDVQARLETAGKTTQVKKLKVRKPGLVKLSIPAPAPIVSGTPVLNFHLIDAAGDRAGTFIPVAVPADG